MVAVKVTSGTRTVEIIAYLTLTLVKTRNRGETLMQLKCHFTMIYGSTLQTLTSVYPLNNSEMGRVRPQTNVSDSGARSIVIYKGAMLECFKKKQIHGEMPN